MYLNHKHPLLDDYEPVLPLLKNYLDTLSKAFQENLTICVSSRENSYNVWVNYPSSVARKDVTVNPVLNRILSAYVRDYCYKNQISFGRFTYDSVAKELQCPAAVYRSGQQIDAEFSVTVNVTEPCDRLVINLSPQNRSQISVHVSSTLTNGFRNIDSLNNLHAQIRLQIQQQYEVFIKDLLKGKRGKLKYVHSTITTCDLRQTPLGSDQEITISLPLNFYLQDRQEKPFIISLR